jgi:hypothetical protein
MVFGFTTLGTPVSSTNKADCQDITEILLKRELNTRNLTTHPKLTLRSGINSTFKYL